MLWPLVPETAPTLSHAAPQGMIDGQKFRRILRQASATLLLSLLVPLGVMIGLVRYSLSSAHWVDHSDQVLAEAYHLERLMVTMQSSFRGYWITRDPAVVGMYDSSRDELRQGVQHLLALVADNPQQVALGQDYAKAVNEWVVTIGGSLAQLQAGRIPTIRLNGPFSVVDAKLRAFIDGEDALRQQRTQRLDQVAGSLMGLFGVALVVGLPALVFWLNRLLQRVSDSYQSTLDASRRRTSELEVTLRSIGDAVIATDPQGGVVFLNPVAEALTGWTNQDARGRPLSEVFVIFNEDTRKIVEDPVSRVLRENVVVGLANHTVLRSLGGDEYPIEDSAAPIRDGGGDVQGVILVFHDVAERRAAEREREKSAAQLREARDRAENASKAKDEFLAVLSHELRTPLAPVLIAAGVLRDDTRLPADVRDQLAMMERNISLEARLIDDLLDLTMIEHRKLQLRLQACDIHSLAGRSIEIIRPDAKAKDIAIDCDFRAANATFVADPDRIQQVIWNLLRNAVKFSARGSRITLRTRDLVKGASGDWLRIEVSDAGIGIDPARLEEIFQPFDQGDTGGDHRFGGVGLGLSIARAVVELHGGRIVAQSAGLDRGATFIVDLPRGNTAAASGVTADEGIAAAAAGPRPKLRLLLIEDHDSTLQTTRRLLERDGHEVSTATSVASALAAAAGNTFDLVISDVGLPDGTGTELMARLRETHGLRGIALSGYGTKEDRERSRAAGFFVHLVKPVRFSDLRQAIAQHPKG
ncbi:MAG TPA: ATP-binding protein [Opitutaceae bacterium]|nr:ATP-binding protein [Opitutaceae bacterium]